MLSFESCEGEVIRFVLELGKRRKDFYVVNALGSSSTYVENPFCPKNNLDARLSASDGSKAFSRTGPSEVPRKDLIPACFGGA